MPPDISPAAGPAEPRPGAAPGGAVAGPAGEPAEDPVARLAALGPGPLQAMRTAAAESIECRRVLAKTGDTVISELMRGEGPLAPWKHFPAGDVYDPEYHAQYYYHRHPEHERADGEHGHFHSFLRGPGMPGGLAPADPGALRRPPEEIVCHLIALAVDEDGQPARLFTVNAWVTGETWFRAEDVIAMLDGFVIDHARPSWPVNRWLTALLRLFRPDVVELIRERDRVLAAAARGRPEAEVLADRGLEVLSSRAIDLDRRAAQVDQALRRARRGR